MGNLDPSGRVTKQVRAAMKGLPFGAFRPVAFYDPTFDQIEIVVQDRSFWEEPVSEWLSLRKANHPQDAESDLVGIVIHQSRKFLGRFAGPWRQEGPEKKIILKMVFEALELVLMREGALTCSIREIARQFPEETAIAFPD